MNCPTCGTRTTRRITATGEPPKPKLAEPLLLTAERFGEQHAGCWIIPKPGDEHSRWNTLTNKFHPGPFAGTELFGNEAAARKAADRINR